MLKVSLIDEQLGLPGYADMCYVRKTLSDQDQ